MPPRISLVELAQSLLRNAELIEASMRDSGGDAYFGSGNETQKLKIARRELLENAQELQVLVRSPTQLLEQYQIHYNSFSCLRWLIHFKIFTHVPADGSAIEYDALASLASVPLSRLRSVVRMSMTTGLFTEPDSTHIAHNQLSSAFAKDPQLRDWAEFITEYGQPTAHAMTEATERWGDTVAKNETAYNVLTGTTMPFFDHVKQVPGMPDLFGRYMRSQGLSEGARLEHVLDGFAWNELRDKAHIVDVGGSKGFVSVALAKSFQGFTFTVQDLPEAIGSSEETLAELPPSIASRIRFVQHDFFQPQPSSHPDWPSPDIYLLRKIIHDWPAPRARDILSQLAKALQDGENHRARILIMDTILPPPGAIPQMQEAFLRVRDLTMAQSFNAKERELFEWEELFASTEPKLKLLGWKQPPASAMAMLEVGLDG